MQKLIRADEKWLPRYKVYKYELRYHFYVVEYAAVLHDNTLVILFVGCAKSKSSNRISKYSQKNVKQWLFIYDMLLAKIFPSSFFIYYSISPIQKKLYMFLKKDSFSLHEIIYSKENTTCLLFIKHTFKLCIVL